MKKIKVLLTSVGGLVAPGMIKSLKSSREYDFTIVGVDAQKEAVGFNFADSSYVVSNGNAPAYHREILDIAKKEKVDVVIPLSDEEMLSLSKAKDYFLKNGIKITCSDYETVRISSDKALMLQYLKDNAFSAPEFYVPKNLKELENFVKKLGYPDKKVVFKPTVARGARGFWLLSGRMDKTKWLLASRDRQEITLEWLLESLNTAKRFPKVLVMEYLEGDDFNVDVLADKGKPLYIIPNKRIVPDAGPVQVGHIIKDKPVQELAAKAVALFKFDYYVNIEIAYRIVPKEEPFIYEINPRVSAPIVANRAAGIDMLLYGIKLALGEDIEKNKAITETKMVRFWDEVYIKG